MNPLLGQPPGSPLMAAPGAGPQGMPLAPQGPQAAPQGAPQGPAFTGANGVAANAQQVAKAHEYADVMVQELTQLLAKPPGQLTKQDVFQGAASLLGKGLFNTPQQRQGLVVSLTQLPDDEQQLRQVLAGQLLGVHSMKQQLDDHLASQGG